MIATSVGVTYAIWSGVGIVLITHVAWLLYGQALDAAAILGLSLIVAGVAVLNLFSKSVAHRSGGDERPAVFPAQFAHGDAVELANGAFVERFVAGAALPAAIAE